MRQSVFEAVCADAYILGHSPSNSFTPLLLDKLNDGEVFDVPPRHSNGAGVHNGFINQQK